MRLRNLIGGIALSLLAMGAAVSAQAQATASTVIVTNKPEQAIIAGKVTVGDTVSITVQDPGLPGGQEIVNYLVQVGDTTGKIATGLIKAINADGNLASIGVSSKRTTESSKPIVNIASNSPNTTNYSGAVSSGGTETITFGVNHNVPENAIIGGTATAGDVISITVLDPGLTGGQQVISYTVVASDTPTSIATGLAANATANKVLKGAGITATAASQHLTIKSLSLNNTTYSASVTGTSERIALSVNPNSIQDVVIGGNPVVNNLITFVVDDVSLPQGTEFVSYKVKTGDTTQSIACGLRTAINADANFKALGLTATCTSGVVSVDSNSPTESNITLGGNATLIGCTVIAGYTGPGTLKICGSVQPTDQAVSVTAATLQGLANPNQYQPGGGNAQDAAAKLTAATNITYYVFKNRNEFFEAASSPAGYGGPDAADIKNLTGQDVPPTTLGLSLLPGGSSTPFTLVFEQYTYALTDNDKVAHTIAHEAGHQLDAIYGGGNASSVFSIQSAFQTAIQMDTSLINQNPACSFNATDGQNVMYQNGTYVRIGGFYATRPGVFSGVQDANGNYICSGSNGSGNTLSSNNAPNTVLTGAVGPAYSSFNSTGTDNFKILQAAFPQFAVIFFQNPNLLAQQNQLNNSRELFAEEYSFVAGYVDTIGNSGTTIPGSDGVLNLGVLSCTKLYVRTLTNYGRLPTAQELSQTGYSVTDPPLTSGVDAGYYGYGATAYFCDGSSSHSNYSFGS